MSEPALHHWTASDGVELAYRTMGEGPPVVLVHGLFSDSLMNWVKFRTAKKVAERGCRVIMPDLRAHGASDAPHEASAYPPGRLAEDLKELIAHLGLDDYILGGFSLGARTTVEAVGSGLKPRKAMLMGMGLEGLSGWLGRKEFFLDAIARFDTVKQGDPAFFTTLFMKSQKIDREAARHLLESFRDAEPEWLDAFSMPAMVLCGTEDQDNGSGQRLAEALPDAIFVECPGNHMSSITKPEFGERIAAFCAQP
jgi:pimeloyl-ACP methyl ester carboxylesterase